MTASPDYNNPMVGAVLSIVRDGIIGVDETGLIRFCNEAAYKMLGYESTELTNTPMDTVIPVENRARHKVLFEKFVAGPKSAISMSGRPEIRALRKDGTVIKVSASVRRVNVDGRSMLLVSLIDQTSQDRLEIAERSLWSTQRAAGVGSWDWNFDTHEFLVSEGVWNLVGTEPRQDLDSSDNFINVIHPEDRERVLRAAETAIAEGKPLDVVHRIVCADGKQRIVRQHGELVRVRRERSTVMSGSVIDITEQTELEAELRHLRKIENMGRVAGAVAHDFNNLLTVIMGNLELLQLEIENDENTGQLLQESLKAAGIAAELTAQLLSYSRRKPFQHQSIDISSAILAMDSIIRRALGDKIDLQISATDDLWLCETDPGQFESALMNLVINAGDAMPDGGQVNIGVRNTVVDAGVATKLKTVELGEYVTFFVRDNGPGISDDILERIFEPFFTTRDAGEGVGLGLSTVRTYVKQSRGHIEVSTGADGTQFTVYLPRQTPSTPSM